MKDITVIHCWSAPRSRSTALLYSFDARDDTMGIDEPLYREWLIQKDNSVSRPYAQAMIQGTPPSDASPKQAAAWRRELLSLEDRLREAAELLPDKGIIFCKHMAKHEHLYDFWKEISGEDIGVLATHKHLLLIRDPVAVLSSWGASSNVHGHDVSTDEVGIIPLLSVYSKVSTNQGQVAVLLSDDLAKEPEAALQRMCADLDICYVPNMMSWEMGPKKCDGPWAAWWYQHVHQSTGWDAAGEAKAAPKKYRTLSPSLLPALSASYPAYDFLYSLTHAHRTRGPPSCEMYEDPRNEHVLVYVGGAGGQGGLVPRALARISPWDSSVQGGDGCWEGLRVYRGKILSLEKHLKRLFKSAKALGYENIHTKEEVVDAIFSVLAANGMRDGAHMRLTLTRGEKYTSSMNPKFNVYGTTLIILPEWKPTEGATTYDNARGISLVTSSQRRNSPQTVDSKIHHNNMINNILPKIQANLAGASDAIMLDMDGFVSETNATNIFMVDDGILLTPHADYCLPGITRATVLELAKELEIPVEVRRVSLAEFHAADEVFTTGTMGELTPVHTIDGRTIGDGMRGPATARLQEAYQTLPERPGWATEIPPFE